MDTLSDRNEYFMIGYSPLCHFHMILPNVMTEQGEKGFPVIRTIKTFEYENRRSTFKCCKLIEKNEKQYVCVFQTYARQLSGSLSAGKTVSNLKWG